MVELIYGPRIGKGCQLRLGVAAIIFDETRPKIVLIRRSDNGRWCLPGGAMDSGESAEEACVREAFEETGLKVRLTKLVGVYSDPNVIIEYKDGNRFA